MNGLKLRVDQPDFDEEEVSTWEALPAIDKNDVLDLKSFLRDFDGDMYDLLVLSD